MWQEGSRIHFQTKVVESNNIVIGSTYSHITLMHIKIIDIKIAYINDQAKQNKLL